MSLAQLLTRAVRSRHSLLGVLLASWGGAAAQTAQPGGPLVGARCGGGSTE